MIKSKFNSVKLFNHTIPLLLTIIIMELITIEISLAPIYKTTAYHIIWLFLQLVPGFALAYLSDRNKRKKILIISQCLGIIGIILLAKFGFNPWVLAFVAITFNPTPIARAAFIDNYPQHSILKLISITFLAQWIPWTFINYIPKIDYTIVLYILLAVQSLNTVLSFLFFKDKYDYVNHDEKHPYPWEILIRKKAILYTIVAFILAELTFYLVWLFLENHPRMHSWLSITTLATLIGICIALLYKHIPHMSIITLLYGIGAGFMLVSFVICLSYPSSSCDNRLINSIINYSVVGGIYLPFVADAVITMSGEKHKAIGAAFIELGGAIATILSPLICIMINLNSNRLLLIIAIIYILAMFSQRHAEKIVRSKNLLG